jgi:hypothetical protein
MQEFLDQQFDADAARRLKHGVRVSAQQQHSAKERLLRRAAAQVVLPPLEVVEQRATLRDHATAFGQHALRVLNWLLLDSKIYERARRPPPFYQYYNVHGRYQFTIIHMSA